MAPAVVEVVDLVSSSSSEGEEEEDEVEVVEVENTPRARFVPAAAATPARVRAARVLPPPPLSSNHHTQTYPHTRDPVTNEYIFADSNHRLPAEIGDGLYSYQHQGVGFILHRWACSQHHGCLLADDMGMGKTVQSVAALTSVFYTQAASTPAKLVALIVVPLAVMGQWQTAVQRTFHVCEVFHGAHKQRALDRVLQTGGVLLSTYDTVSTTANLDALLRVHWDCLVIDEATKIKNYKTGAFKSLRALADRAKRRLALSATPFENNLLEMWALFDFSCAGKLLGKRADFERHFVQGIERAASSSSSLNDNTAAVALIAKLNKTLHDLIAPNMMRREKSLLKELGEAAAAASSSRLVPQFNVSKVDCVIWVSLSPAQRSAYEQFLESDSVKEALNKTSSPLAAITVLRKICDDTRLLPELPVVSSSSSSSNKMRVLMALLQDLCVENGHKTVVFCNSKRMLDFMEAESTKQLSKRGFTHLRVDGDMKPEDRARRIRAFNLNEPLVASTSTATAATATAATATAAAPKWDCLFLTTGVGALGIEITGADRVVLFQPHWNPAQDDQAVDRCFRLGQRRNVVCFRLITVGTVEEKMCDIQLRKSALARNVLQAGKGNSYAYSQNMADLFTLDEELTTEEELAEVYGGNARRNAQQVQQVLGHHEGDCRELTSLLEALTVGGGGASSSSSSQHDSLAQLHEQRVVLSASERSLLFQENSRQVQLGMQALTREERENMEQALENALESVAGGGGGVAEEEWIPRRRQ